MTLGFSTTFKDGRPTQFQLKIRLPYRPGFLDHFPDLLPKIHTFRVGHRWRAGMAIQMVIGNRTPQRYQFNADIPALQTCISVQDAIVGLDTDDDLFILIGTFEHGYYLTREQLLLFAVNDGFNSLDELRRWFFPKGFTGKAPVLDGQIIHWTDFKYPTFTPATAPEKQPEQ